MPDYYITYEEAEEMGWKPKKANLAETCPGKMIGGERYSNNEKSFPMPPIEYGVKQISIIPRDIEIATEFIIPTTVLFL